MGETVALKSPKDEKCGICWWCKKSRLKNVCPSPRNYVNACNKFEPIEHPDAADVEMQIARGVKLSKLPPPVDPDSVPPA